jgi:hypothetical protein
MGDIDLLIGQPVINLENVSFIIDGGRAQLIDKVTHELSRITLNDAEKRPRLVVHQEVTLPANFSTLVQVDILGADVSAIIAAGKWCASLVACYRRLEGKFG